MKIQFNPFTKNFDYIGESFVWPSEITILDGRVGINKIPQAPWSLDVSGNISTENGGLYGVFVASNIINARSSPFSLVLNNSSISTPNTFTVVIGAPLSGFHSVHNEISGSNGGLLVKPKYDQIGSTASNTDLKVNRIVSNIGSGDQLLLDLQKDDVSYFSVDANGVARLKNGSGQVNIECLNDGAVKTTSSSGAVSFTVKKTLIDDELYTIFGIASGLAHIIAETTTIDVYGLVNVYSDGVSTIAGSVATADIDGQLCIYKSGSDLIIKNRRGSSRTVTIKIG